MGNSIYAYDIPKRTQQDLLEEREYQDFSSNVEFNQRGLPHYLLTGHGQELNTFEKRDICTTKDMAYTLKKTAHEIIHPMYWKSENTDVSKVQINGSVKDVPAFSKALNTKEAIKPRGYNEYTKKFDNNC